MKFETKRDFFIHRFSNAAKVVNKRIPRGFSLPNVHYAVFYNLCTIRILVFKNNVMGI